MLPIALSTLAKQISQRNAARTVPSGLPVFNPRNALICSFFEETGMLLIDIRVWLDSRMNAALQGFGITFSACFKTFQPSTESGLERSAMCS